MTDIVDRLRTVDISWSQEGELCAEAADEIIKLRKDNKLAFELMDTLVKEIKQLRLANSDLQMYYDYAKTECDKLQAEVLKLREELNELRLSYEVVVDALKEKE